MAIDPTTAALDLTAQAAKIALEIQAAKNTPEEITAAVRFLEQREKERITRDVANEDLEAVRKDVAS